MEITEDAEDEEYEYDEIKDSDEEKQTLPEEDDEEDLNNFDLLKAKTTMKLAMQTKCNIIKITSEPDSVATFKIEPKPRVINRDVVIDDFIRNFLKRF